MYTTYEYEQDYMSVSIPDLEQYNFARQYLSMNNYTIECDMEVHVIDILIDEIDYALDILDENKITYEILWVKE